MDDGFRASSPKDRMEIVAPGSVVDSVADLLVSTHTESDRAVVSSAVKIDVIFRVVASPKRSVGDRTELDETGVTSSVRSGKARAGRIERPDIDGGFRASAPNQSSRSKDRVHADLSTVRSAMGERRTPEPVRVEDGRLVLGLTVREGCQHKRHERDRQSISHLLMHFLHDAGSKNASLSPFSERKRKKAEGYDAQCRGFGDGRPHYRETASAQCVLGFADNDSAFVDEVRARDTRQ